MSAGSVSTKPRLSAEILIGTAKHRLLREARTNRNKKLGERVKVGKNGTSRVVQRLTIMRPQVTSKSSSSFPWTLSWTRDASVPGISSSCDQLGQGMPFLMLFPSSHWLYPPPYSFPSRYSSVVPSSGKPFPVLLAWFNHSLPHSSSLAVSLSFTA